MKKIRLKKQAFSLKARDIFILICFLVAICTIFIVIKFNHIITPKLLEAADMKIHAMTSLIITKSFDKENLGDLNNLLNMETNDNGDINSIDFNLEKAYEVARNVTDAFHRNYSYIENGSWEKIGYYDADALKDADGYILSYPIGIASKNIFLANLGPKIPVRVKFVGTTLNTIETKLTEYGINNVLIEIFVTMTIERQIILPVQFKRDKTNYSMPISSKIIMGKIPSWYGGVMTKSANLNVPILE